MHPRCRPPCAQQACSRCPTRCHEYICGTFDIRQARGSPAAPAQPCFWSARPGTSSTTRARECRRSSAAVRRSARSFYSILLSAAHDKAQSHAAPLHALTSRLRGSTGAVLQRGLCEHRGSRPKFRERRRLSVRLLLRRHRSAGCQPKQPATALERRSRRWLWAPRRRFTRPRARIVSGDENLARRKCAEPLSRRRDVTAMPASLRCSTVATTIAVAVSSGQPGSKKTGGRQRNGRSVNKLDSTRCFSTGLGEVHRGFAASSAPVGSRGEHQHQGPPSPRGCVMHPSRLRKNLGLQTPLGTRANF